MSARSLLQDTSIGQHWLIYDSAISIRPGRCGLISFQTLQKLLGIWRSAIPQDSLHLFSVSVLQNILFKYNMTPAPGMVDGAVSSPISNEKERYTSFPAVSQDNNPLSYGTKPEETSAENTQGMETLTRIATSDYPHAFKLSFIVVALMLSMFLVSLDMTIVATAIPRITDEFHSLKQVGWYGSAFFLTLGAFQSTWGKAYKYFHLKPSFLIAIGIFELGSLICGVAQNSTTLIIGRAIAGRSFTAHLSA